MSSESAPRTLRALRLLLLRDLEAFQREIALFPQDDDLWRVPPGILNPAGNLALHAAGNLRHFVGAILGGDGFVRDREGEFSRRAGSRAEVLAELARAREVVAKVLGALPPARLSEPFPEALRGLQTDVGTLLMHLATHLAFHLGQAGYHRRALLGDSTSAQAMSVQELMDPD
ncbi:MAG: DinB family protein [Acidobacteria bacterium]|nr:DinB family protein [Acidobacteriota bacterium]